MYFDIFFVIYKYGACGYNSKSTDMCPRVKHCVYNTKIQKKKNKTCINIYIDMYTRGDPRNSTKIIAYSCLKTVVYCRKSFGVSTLQRKKYLKCLNGHRLKTRIMDGSGTTDGVSALDDKRRRHSWPKLEEKTNKSKENLI